jgi:broad specificity phosphatase PhoE
MTDHVRLLCMRHAESENVVAGIAGQLPLFPLTAHGRDQAAATARVLRGNHSDIARIYTSTAVRAVQTAGILSSVLGAPTVQTHDLIEVGIGNREGATDAQTRARTAQVLHAWVVKHDLSERTSDGETGHQVLTRIRTALNQIADAHPGKTVAVVGHVASLTVGLSSLCGLADRVWGTPLPHVTPFLVERINQTWHCHDWPTPTSG